ncbi:MAG: glycosyl transferase [Vicinamibacteria bacterium]|nr:glycosyl transferase [Vicinamibacteria bacterium]
MIYGHFDDAHKEYVITNPRTPVKWINYVGTLAFGGFVDHTGGAMICKGDPATNRITRYIGILPASEFRGSTLYVRMKQNDGYRVFSPFFVPTLDPYDRFECHVGLGFSRWITEFHGIRSEITVFVPVDDERLIHDIRLTNLADHPREIDLVPVVEYSHFLATLQFTNADWVPQTMQSRAHHYEDGRKILAQYAFMHRDTSVNFLTASWPASSFETERPRFLGDNEYGTWAAPLSLGAPELGDNEARRGDNVGALMLRLGTLSPGENRRVVTQLGQCESIRNGIAGIRDYWNPARADQAFQEIGRFWDDYLEKQNATTPDPDLDHMLNVHNPRQCFITLNWSRYLSIYQPGYGSRGIGFRDSSQDVLGVLPSAPERAKELLKKLLAVQKRNGSAMHQFNPLSLEASVGDAADIPNRPQYYSDDHLWSVLAVCAYLKETGDFAFLEETIPYYEKDRDGRPLESGTVIDHLSRAIHFTRGDVGAHGLPLLGFADWNDPTNLPAGAESLFTANLYGKALCELISLCRYRGDDATAELLQASYESMRASVNKHAWDGEWYVRYFDAEGTPLGSHSNNQSQIYVNGQSWPVISGFATPERARVSMAAVYGRLNTPKGIKLSTPGFNGYDPRKGGITTFPPGAKENCGIFLHANPWAIIAETILGNGERAYEYYRQINPAAKNERIDEYQCEPFVYCQNVAGDEHPQFGLARNSWLTGTAAWMYVAGTQHILGVRPEHGGLRVDPCIPSAWDGFKVKRVFRGATYRITIRNPSHVCRGVRALRIDGNWLEGNVVPAFEKDAEHEVDVELG